MPYWWEFETDLVGDNSDAPRLPAHQVRSLYSHDHKSLQEPARRRAWELLLARPDKRRGRRRG